MKFENTPGYQTILQWMKAANSEPFDFQKETWEKYSEGFSGIVNAPTGFGKTFSVFLAVLIAHINRKEKNLKRGLRLMWITPLRSLSKDIGRAMQEAITQLGLPWEVAVRNGDTPLAERQRLSRQMPEILVTTPETLHLMLAQKNHPDFFKNLECVSVDEWHELMGSKRGVLVELGLSRLRGLLPQLRVWGLSATIGNLDQALDVLLPNVPKKILVKTKEKKKIKIVPIIPDEIDKLPWAGHMGTSLAKTLIPVVENSRTTLIFTNTRGQSEVWYQTLLNVYPELAGAVALHHGSIDLELRNWIEDALHAGILEAVICTSSLDLGVDFKPVDSVVQIGSPKGVARFLQRAGRSGHSPHETSVIYFLPTHSLELLEAAALKEAYENEMIEDREPFLLSFDVLVQYLVTLAVGAGFESDKIYDEIKNTYAFAEILPEEWDWAMQFITVGGETLGAYDEFKKVEKDEDGLWRVKSRRIAMNHRMNIGAIVSEPMVKVKYRGGGYIGMVEEGFASRLNPGDSFVLGGAVHEYLQMKEMTLYVKKSSAKKAISPSWTGGRMPLSANLTKVLRKKFTEAAKGISKEPEAIVLTPLFDLQRSITHVPEENELLIEKIDTKEGHHLFVYPFEGRLAHELLASLIAYRIGKIKPISFSIAMNDYGFELLSDDEIPLDENNVREIFSIENLTEDIQKSINASEMARRKFRQIASIAGLIYQNAPGKQKTNRSLQASSSLFFNVFEQYDPTNLLMRQAYDEVFYHQLEEPRLRMALMRIAESGIVIKSADRYTPLSFPIKVDSIRETITSEKLEDRVEKLKRDMEW